jgi:spore coat polysaccharide biosynthesis predicted glycosyltransferase SpsG
VRDGAHRVLITTGGGDPDEAAIGLVGAARNALPGAELRLVIGPQAAGRVPDGIVPVSAPESLYDEMRAADLIICGAGQSAFEAVSLGVPTAVVPLVDNQMGNAQRLAEAQAARVLWPGDDPRPHLRELATDPEVRAGLAQRGRLTIDGRGARRVAAKILAALIGAAA